MPGCQAPMPGSDGDAYLKMIRHNTATIVRSLSGA
jgi:hypothetical protein